MSTLVKITNTYSTRWNFFVAIVPSPGLEMVFDPSGGMLDNDELDEWWEEVVFPLTGDGFGESEDALYEASVIDSDIPELIGESYDWSG